MGFYTDRILPWGIDLCMRGEDFSRFRKQYLAPAQGDVLEVGFGSGLNLPHYPDTVKKLWALDPSRLGRKLARKRLAAVTFPVEFIDLAEGERIPLDNESVDCVVTTWTLCTIPNVSAALQEFKRVLKPGGQYIFLEHGLSPEENIARWQNRLNPIQKCFAGGCHLNRKIDDLIRASGLKIKTLENFYFPCPKIAGYMYAGVAVLAHDDFLSR